MSPVLKNRRWHF